MSMLLFVTHRLWSIFGDSGSVVSSVVSSDPALLSFHMLTGNLDRAQAPPAHSARRARATRGETACGGPTHRHPSPSRVGPVHPTGQASPSTAPVACDTAPPRAHGMPGVVAHPMPTPGEGTSGSRVRHDRGETRTP